jgi:hypothetical protein
MANNETVEREVEHLRKVLTRIGKQEEDGTGARFAVSFSSSPSCYIYSVRCSSHRKYSYSMHAAA